MSDWLNPINRIIIRNAVIRRFPKARVSNNETYLFDYDRKPGMVWIQREGKLVPCGLFEIQRINSPTFLMEG